MLPITVADLSGDARWLFSVQPLSVILRHLARGALPTLREMLDDAVAPALGVRAFDESRARQPLPVPFRGVVGDYTALSLMPRTRAAYASSTAATPGATHHDPQDIAVVCVPGTSLAEQGPAVLYHERGLTGSAACVSGDPAVLQGAAWRLIHLHRIAGAGTDPDELQRYDSGALVWGNVPMRAVSAIACVDSRSEARLRAAPRLGDIQIVRRAVFLVIAASSYWVCR